MQLVTESNISFLTFCPLIGSALAFWVGKKRKEAAGWIATVASFLSFLWAIKLYAELPSKGEGILEDHLFNWFSVGEISVDLAFRFDALTAIMCLVITGVGTLIHLYSVSYMEDDPSKHRFFSYLNLFMFSMLTLVLGSNLLVMFVGWEGVGLCSYLLIGFWFKNIDYAAAGRKAFIVNRIGDFGFLIGIFLIFQYFGTLDFIGLKTAIGAGTIPVWLPTIIALALFIGATGKSAQIPLFVWLPDAMAGPTPVSALIHAATMVTAGVYMMARCHFIFDLAPMAMFIVSIIACLTAFIAGTTALTQNDIKKVLAYSTVSQLGFMFMGVSSGLYWVGIFHLVTHAFFKACLFLGAGSVIHGCHHEQDMRHMGGLSHYMPITFWTFTLSTIAIAGVWPFSGYYSKHAILAALAETHNPYLLPYKDIIIGIATLTAFITAFYMTRCVAMTFLGEYRGHAHPHESPPKMTAPLVILAIAAFFGGFILEGPISHMLAPVLGGHSEHHSSGILQSIISSWPGILGVFFGLVLYTKGRGIPEMLFATFKPLGVLFSRKYYFDEIYQLLIVKPLSELAFILWKGVDQSVIDGSVNGVAAVTEVNGEVLRGTQTGIIAHYALFMFIGTAIILAFYFVL